MKAALARNKVLAGLITALLAFGIGTLALAGKGTKTISSVVDNSDGSYYVVLDSVTGITVGDHFGCTVADGSGAVYSVAEVGTAVRVADTLTEENGGTYGSPVAGSAWYSTPSTNIDLSKPPYQGVGWDAPLRRNAHLIESTLGTASGLYGISEITTAATGDIFVYGANNHDKWTLLTPGTSGQVLTANGAGALPSWQAGGGTNALLDGTNHTDTAAQTVSRGSIVYGNSTPAWDELTVGSANTILTADGTDISWGTFTALVDGAVSSTQGSFLYRNGSSWTAIAPQTSGKILVTQGAAANPNYYTLSQLLDGAIGNTQGDILYRNASGWVVLGAGTSGDVLTTQGAGANPIWSTPGGGTTHDMLSATHTDSTAAAVSRGSLIVGDSTPKWTELTVGAANTIVSSDGTDTSFQTLSALIDGAIGNTRGSVLYRGASGWAILTPGTSGHVLTSNGAGADPSYQAGGGGGSNQLLDGSTHTDTTNTSAVQGALIYANSTPAWTSIAPQTSGKILTTQGSGQDPTYYTLSKHLDATVGSTHGTLAFRGASGWTAIAPSTSGLYLRTNGSGQDPVWSEPAAGDSREFIHLQDQKTSGTAGGTATAGSWETRTLNTEVSDTGNNCALSSNQFTLDAGTYEISAKVPGFRVSYLRGRLQNVTDGATVLYGTTQYCEPSASAGDIGRSHIRGRFTITGSKTFEIQQRVATTRSTNGMSPASSLATEIYTDVRIYKVTTAVATGGEVRKFLHYQHQETSGTAGGTATTGSWETRTLNTEVADTGGNGSLSSNAVTLDAGTYEIVASAAFYDTDASTIRWRNTTDGTTAVSGVNIYTASGGAGDCAIPATLRGRFTIAASKTFELQSRVATTQATDGWGVASSWQTEVYADVQLYKVE